MFLRLIAIAILILVIPDLRIGPTYGQATPSTRRVTNLTVLATYPTFFHQRPVTVAGTVTRMPNGTLQLADDTRQIRVIYNGNTPDGLAEVRGEFWDLGRMNADDPRLTTYDIRKVFEIDPDGPWPRSGQSTAIIANDVATAPLPASASIRSVALFPARYLDSEVTVTGQFAGRNLLGDLPDTPARSQYDFVLRSADAAIWVANLRPRGPDFELSLDTRIDTGRWVEVTGRVQQVRGLLVLDAQGKRIALRPAPAETPLATPVQASKAPPPEIVFSMPTQNETEVSWSSAVRIQFSRELDQRTLKDRVRVSYLMEEARARGEPDVPVINFTIQYFPANNVLELKFTENLERYRTIKVELLEGILATDKQPLQPWTLSFVTGSH
jgi:hypothetical protein